MRESGAFPVFIEYVNDSRELHDRVRDLAVTLRKDGIDCRVDQFSLVPAEGWDAWVEAQRREAGLVLVVCTEGLYRGMEGPRAASLSGEAVVPKLVAVTLDGSDLRWVSASLEPRPRFRFPSQYR